MKILINVLILFIFFVACGEKSDEVENAIISARNHLSFGRCQQAIDKLAEVGFQGRNANYIKTIASGYACRAGYKTSAFITDDLPSTVTPAPLGGVSTYGTSDDMTALDSSDYVDLKQAINYLLYAGDIPYSENPAVVKRAARFSSVEAQDINTFALYTIFVQLGKYFRYYGNASAAGAKGAGAGSNNCFANYTNVALDNTTTAVYADTDAVLDALGGACDSGETGHPDLGGAGSLSVARMCEVVVLFNNLTVLLPEVLTGGFDDLDDITGVQAVVEAQKTVMESEHKPMTITNVLSQELCEDQSIDDIQVYFAFVIEPLIQ